MSATAASERPVHTVLSGPAGGVTSTVMISRRTGFRKLLAFDMGGTSTDVSVIIDGEPTISRSTEVGIFPGQGADARRAQRRRRRRLDRRGLRADQFAARRTAQRRRQARSGRLRPRRHEPTVSDANVVLGYLPPVLLGGDMALDVAAARKAVMPGVGKTLGLSAGRSGQGHHRHRQRGDARRAARHHRAARPRSARLRHRRLRRRRAARMPTRWPSCSAAIRCWCRPIPGVLSALGFLEADFKNEFVQTFIRSTDRPRHGEGVVALRRARRQGQGLARRAGGGAGGRVDRLRARPSLRAAGLRGARSPCSPELVHGKGALAPKSSPISTPLHRAALRRALPCAGGTGRAARRRDAARRRRSTKPRRRRRAADVQKAHHRDAAGLFRRRLAGHAALRPRPGSASATGSPVRRSSANTTRRPCCLPGHHAEVDGHGNHPDLAGCEGELSTMASQGRSHHARHHRERAEERALRDGRRRRAHLAVAGHPRAARRIPDDLQRARPDDRRPVRLLHPRDRRAVRGRHQRGRHLRLERSLCLQGLDLAQQRLVRDDADLP